MQRCLVLVVAVVLVTLMAGCGGGGGGGGTLLPLYTYLATRNLNPGSILRADGVTEQVVLTRPAQRLTSFLFDGPTVSPPALAADWAYYTNAVNGMDIYRADDTVVYTHPTFVRDLAVGPDGALYFSESYGAGADGIIYRFGGGGIPAPFYTVRIADVGFFAGNFGFDPEGTLHISNGNVEGAGLWRCPPGIPPTCVFTRADGGSLMGFHFTFQDRFLFTDATDKVRQGMLAGSTSTVMFESPGGNEYRDVFVSDQLY